MIFRGSSLPMFLFFLTDHLLATSDNLMLIVSSFNSPNNPVLLISKHLLSARKSLVRPYPAGQDRVHQRFSSRLQMPLFQYHSPLPAVASYMRQLPRYFHCRRVNQQFQSLPHFPLSLRFALPILLSYLHLYNSRRDLVSADSSY